MIVGLDEVGTGAWAGPIAVGAVATPFSQPCFWPDVNDSKQLSQEDRAWLYQQIAEADIPWAVGGASNAEIDAWGLTRAKRVAAQRALHRIFTLYPHIEEHSFEIVIDGNNKWGLDHGDDEQNRRWLDLPRQFARIVCQIKADEWVKEVSAASVMAKHSRDTFMRQLACLPQYKAWGWESSVGYGTPFHKENLDRYGPTMWHRRSVKPVQKALRGDKGE